MARIVDTHGDETDIEILRGAAIRSARADDSEWEIEIKLCPSRSEANEISKEFGTVLGPGTRYNQSVSKLLAKMNSKGARIALRNPLPSDGVIVIILSLVGKPVLTAMCNLLNSWIKAKGGRKLSITEGRRKIESKGVSPKALLPLLRGIKKLDLEFDTESRRGGATTMLKKRKHKTKSPGARKK